MKRWVIILVCLFTCLLAQMPPPLSSLSGFSAARTAERECKPMG
jgi:hypothetical protein